MTEPVVFIPVDQTTLVVFTADDEASSIVLDGSEASFAVLDRPPAVHTKKETALVHTPDQTSPTLFIAHDSGPAGPVGPQGPPGVNDDKHAVHNQMTPATSWVFNHNLDKYPSITVVDSGGTQNEVHVDYITANQVVLTLAYSVSGTAYAN